MLSSFRFGEPNSTWPRSNFSEGILSNRASSRRTYVTRDVSFSAETSSVKNTFLNDMWVAKEDQTSKVLPPILRHLPRVLHRMQSKIQNILWRNLSKICSIRMRPPSDYGNNTQMQTPPATILISKSLKKVSTRVCGISPPCRPSNLNRAKTIQRCNSVNRYQFLNDGSNLYTENH